MGRAHGGRRVKATIIECIMGVFGFDERNRLIDSVLFPKDARKIAEGLAKIEGGSIVDETVALINRLKSKGYTFFVFENSETANDAREKLGISVEAVHPSEAGELLRSNLESFAIDAGFVKEDAQLREWTHRVSMELARMRIRKAAGKRDLVVAHAIQTVDDFDMTANIFMGRIREWYGLHFPELDRLVEKHETYARLVVNLGHRENFTVDGLEKAGLPKAKAKQISKAVERSIGADMGSDDLLQIQTLCRNALQIYDARQSLEHYLDSAMGEVAPNVKALVGSLLGARLIAMAGGLNNLAKMPSSTVQVLGAEKALFRSLKTGSRPPKHGILFQHTLIHEAKRWQRGKMARALAGKLAIAARIDAFSGKYMGDDLRTGLESRTREIQEKYRRPPAKKQVASRVKKRQRRMRRGRKG